MRLSDLSPQRWKQLQRIAGEVMDAPPAQRDAVLEEQCSGDTVLRSAALELLKDFSETTGLLGFAPPLAAGLGSVRTGTRIGAYRIIRELGQGGMGTVYLATRDDGAFDKQVALKTIPRFGGQALFARERQILARLEHPGIARLLDGGTTGDGTQFLAMEFVDGVEITAYAAGRPVQEILGLFLQVCGAIRYAHQNLVIHRDLKPANILVTAAGVAKVLDFGIAKLLEDGADTAMTQAVMTPAWASPEQRAGAPANTLSDVYSLGLILYRLLTGVLPKAGEPIARPSQWRPELAGGFGQHSFKSPGGRHRAPLFLRRTVQCRYRTASGGQAGGGAQRNLVVPGREVRSAPEGHGGRGRRVPARHGSGRCGNLHAEGPGGTPPRRRQGAGPRRNV
jgi:predicted Ser/Thr protein kinase